MKRLASVLCLAMLPALVSCARTMTAAEFGRQFPAGHVPTTARIPQEDKSDTEAARMAAAQQYLDAIGPEQLIATMLHEEAKARPASEREAFLRIATRALSVDALRPRIIELVVKHYTRTQILAFTQFVETREGRSAMRKVGRRSGPPEPSEGVGDTPEDRRVAVQRYFVVVDFRRLYGDTVRGKVGVLPPGTDRERLFGQAAAGYEAERRELGDQLVRYFTRREIDAMTRFYGSPVGEAVLVRMALLMADVAPLIVERIRQAGSVAAPSVLQTSDCRRLLAAPVSASPSAPHSPAVNPDPPQRVSGPPIDHSDPRIQAYFADIKRRIERHWVYPQEAIRRGQSGSGMALFTVRRDGRVDHIQIVQSTGSVVLDRYMENAIRFAAPFASHPCQVTEEIIPFTMPFSYTLGDTGKQTP